ncbi:MAG: methyl-accepting chemotaxis protein [Tepidanaerobacteraceae bacterium]|nr:methyl-accepting chemotaxis protein [Tepidanaerobacteraceae bacterium]
MDKKILEFRIYSLLVLIVAFSALAAVEFFKMPEYIFEIVSCAGLLMSIVLLHLLTESIVRFDTHMRKSMESAAKDNTEKKKIFLFAGLANQMKGFIDTVKGIKRELKIVSEQAVYLSEQLSRSVQDVDSSYSQIVESIQSVAGGAEHQAALSVESKGRLSDLLEKSNNILARARTTGEGFKTLLDVLNNSFETLKLLIEDIVESGRHSEALVRDISELTEKSKKIGDITISVENVAEQTNLLALNAAIEAARAGEYGRGFAVVAQEIRKLAEESKVLAKNIGEILGEMVGGINKNLETTRKNLQRSVNHVSNARQTQTFLENVFRTANEVERELAEIEQNASGQAKEVKNIVDSFNDIVKVTEETSAATQEVAAASEQQKAALEELSRMAAYLKNTQTRLNEIIRSFGNDAVISEDKKGAIEKLLDILRKNAKSKEIVSMDRNEHKKVFEKLQGEHPEFQILYSAAGGRLFYITRQVDIEDISFRPWYCEAIKGNSYVSEPYIPVGTDDTCVTVSVPIKNEKGHVVGVFASDIKIKDI